MKEFLLELIFALVVVCSFYGAGNQLEGIDPSAATGTIVETVAFADDNGLGVLISAYVFGSTLPLADLTPAIPFPMPRPQRT